MTSPNSWEELLTAHASGIRSEDFSGEGRAIERAVGELDCRQSHMKMESWVTAMARWENDLNRKKTRYGSIRR
jgi:hypothetical protein